MLHIYIYTYKIFIYIYIYKDNQCSNLFILHNLFYTTICIYIYILYIQLAEHSLVHLLQQYVTINQICICISCLKAIVVKIGRARFLSDFIYYTHLASARFEHFECHGSHTSTIMLLNYLFQYFFDSLVPAMCDQTSCKQVHQLPPSHSGDNRESSLNTMNAMDHL